METLNGLVASGLFLSCNHAANAAAIASVTGSVRVTGSPSTPATATPRMSLPFCSLRKSVFSMDGVAAVDGAAE